MLGSSGELGGSGRPCRDPPRSGNAGLHRLRASILPARLRRRLFGRLRCVAAGRRGGAGIRHLPSARSDRYRAWVRRLILGWRLSVFSIFLYLSTKLPSMIDALRHLRRDRFPREPVSAEVRTWKGLGQRALRHILAEGAAQLAQPRRGDRWPMKARPRDSSPGLRAPDRIAAPPAARVAGRSRQAEHWRPAVAPPAHHWRQWAGLRSGSGVKRSPRPGGRRR